MRSPSLRRWEPEPGQAHAVQRGAQPPPTPTCPPTLQVFLGTPSRWVPLRRRVAWRSPPPARSREGPGQEQEQELELEQPRGGRGACRTELGLPSLQPRCPCPAPRKPRGAGGREELGVSGVVQPRGREPDISARGPRADPAASEPKAKGAAAAPRRGVGGRGGPGPRAGRSAGPPLCDFTRVATSPAARAPPSPARRPPARPPAAASAPLRAALPARPARLARLPDDAHSSPGRRPRPCAPQGGRRLDGRHVAPPRPERPDARPRDAALPQGHGLRPLPAGDLVLRRLHHLLRGRRALGARQPLPPLHQVGWAARGDPAEAPRGATEAAAGTPARRGAFGPPMNGI